MEVLSMANTPAKGNTKKYTVKEVANMENHAELIGGKLVITECTTVSHQRAVRKIEQALNQYIEEHNGQCEVFRETVFLFCNELCDHKDNLFMPDIMVVCDKSGIKENGIHVAPKFVAEVTSVSTKKQDYLTKTTVYDEIGVQEYWIVDLQRKVIVRHLSENEFLPEMYFYPASTVIPVQSYPGLEIDVSQIFE